MGQHLNLFKETTLEKQYIGMPFKDAEIHAKECCSDNLMRYHAFLYTVISRKVVGKNVHATIPKGNMGYDQYTVPDDCSCRTYFCCFPLALANTFPWPFVPILSNFFAKRELKTTHNAFQDCSVHFS